MLNIKNPIVKYAVPIIAGTLMSANMAYAGAKERFGGMVRTMTQAERSENLSRGIDFLESEGIEAREFSKVIDDIKYSYFRNDDVDGDNDPSQISIREGSEVGTIVVTGSDDIVSWDAMAAVRGDDGKVHYSTTLIPFPVGEAVRYRQGTLENGEKIDPDKMSIVGIIGYDKNGEARVAKSAICFDNRRQVPDFYDGKNVWTMNVAPKAVEEVKQVAELEEIVEKSSDDGRLKVNKEGSNIDITMNIITQEKGKSVSEEEIEVASYDGAQQRWDLPRGEHLNAYMLPNDVLMVTNTGKTELLKQYDHFAKVKTTGATLLAFLGNAYYTGGKMKSNSDFSRVEVGHNVRQRGRANHRTVATGPCDVRIDDSYASYFDNDLYNRYLYGDNNHSMSGSSGGISLNGMGAAGVYTALTEMKLAQRRDFLNRLMDSDEVYFVNLKSLDIVGMGGAGHVTDSRTGVPGSGSHISQRARAQAGITVNQLKNQGWSYGRELARPGRYQH